MDNKDKLVTVAALKQLAEVLPIHAKVLINILCREGILTNEEAKEFKELIDGTS